MKSRFRLELLVLCVIAQTVTAIAQPHYVLTVVAPAYGRVQVRTIGNGGIVSGWVGNSWDGEPFTWKDGVFTRLPPLVEGTRAAAQCANSHGVVVGYAKTADDRTVAVRWISGVPHDLGISQTQSSGAMLINEQGLITGIKSGGGFLYEDGVVTSFSIGRSALTGVNRDGIVVGYTIGHDSGDYPFIWSKRGGFEQFVPNRSGRAKDINDSGVVVGYLDNFGPFVWKRGVLKPVYRFSPSFITNSGLMLGWDHDLRTEAIMKWNYRYRLQDLILNPGTWEVTDLMHASKDGHILAWASNRMVSRRPFFVVLKPVFAWP